MRITGGHRTTILLAVPLLFALVGCSGGAGDDAAATAVATQFAEALTNGDTDGACELLAQGTRASVEQEAGTSCGQALSTLELPTMGAAHDVQAYGRGAQVKLATDVLFLTLESSGWRVTAAGCTQRQDRPYHCAVKGE
ncbi:MAG: hypothetical protein JWQ68_461 [Cryobacterium sp.]|nr:hypothetical protein [Cryobacterium sp.]